MRLVELSIPAGKRDAILRVLDDEGIDYVLVDEVSHRDYTGVVSFPLPTNAVEPVLDRLREAEIEDETFIVVLDAETVISRRLDRLIERYERDEEVTDNVPREEIRERARQLAPDVRTYSVMTAVSVAIATAGILLDSAAVVVGSMVIAPLIGPAMSTSVGTVLRDRDLFTHGVRLQIFGFALAVVTASVFAFLVKVVHVVPPTLDVISLGQVRGRLTPGFLSLVVALGSGIAGAYSLSSGVSTSLVGVAIAVALVPPTAVIGIGIAWELPLVVVGSTVLVVVNFLSINLGSLAVLWYQGYRPVNVLQEEQARRETLKRLAALALAVALLSTFLGGVTYYSYQSALFEQAVRDDVESVLDRPQYDDLVLIEVTIEYGDPILNRNPETVIVTVGREPGTEYPGLAVDIAEAVDRGLRVEVRSIQITRPDR